MVKICTTSAPYYLHIYTTSEENARAIAESQCQKMNDAIGITMKKHKVNKIVSITACEAVEISDKATLERYEAYGEIHPLDFYGVGQFVFRG